MIDRGMGFPADGVDNHGWKLYITSLVMIISSGLFVVARYIICSSVDLHTTCDTPWLRNAQSRSRKARSPNGAKDVLYRSDTIQGNRLPQQSRRDSAISPTIRHEIISSLVICGLRRRGWIQYWWCCCDNLAMCPHQRRMGQVS
ncbi:hypothetical protein LB505_010716 [Fusarium chuoi]|nr:hypothetical protein LB505_010716 [Fusarium chuoi]